MKLFSLSSCLALAAMLPVVLPADDLADAPFSLRFPAAFGHVSFYGDVAALSNASAASKWESSPNPANKAWGFQEEYDWRLSGQYSNVGFDNGTEFNLTSETAAIDAGGAGVFRFALLQIRSNEDWTYGSPLGLGGKKFGFDLDAVQLSWGKLLSDQFSLGAEVGYSHGETTFTQPSVTLLGVTTPFFVIPSITLPEFELIHADKDAWSYRLGGLWKPADKWFVGLYGDYVRGTVDTTVTPSPLSTVRFRSTDVVQQWNVHPGIAYEFEENAMVHADYEASWLSDDYGHDLQLNRWSVGTDIPLMKFLYLRAGAAVDAHSNFSWSSGIGFYPSKHVFIDLAYQNDAFPELKQEFGRSRTLNASIAIQW